MTNLDAGRSKAFFLLLGLLLATFLIYTLLSNTYSEHLFPQTVVGGSVLGVMALFGLLAENAPAAESLAPLVAIVGCDGAGKSTLAADVVGLLGKKIPVASSYLGLGSGEMGEKIKRWPLIGPKFEARLAKKAKQARSKDKKIPGLPTALVIFAFSVSRRRRFRHMLALRRRGVTVITDRYPQTEVPGFYDGPGLSAARAGNRIVGWLAKRERRMYEEMASYRPDLVIRLNVDARTAYARKPEHGLSSLQAKVAVTPTLLFNGAHIVDLDAREPYEQVRRETLDYIGQTLDNIEQERFSARDFHLSGDSSR